MAATEIVRCGSRTYGSRAMAPPRAKCRSFGKSVHIVMKTESTVANGGSHNVSKDKSLGLRAAYKI